MTTPVMTPIIPTSKTGITYVTPQATNGVAMTQPGLTILPSITAAINDACKTIPAGKHLALVAVTATVNGEVRSNAALVSKIGESVAVAAWMGKTWKKDAGTEWGAQVVVTL